MRCPSDLQLEMLSKQLTNVRGEITRKNIKGEKPWRTWVFEVWERGRRIQQRRLRIERPLRQT